MNISCIRRFLRLTLLAPPIVEAIMAGKAPRTLSLTKLGTNLPWAWQEQMKFFDEFHLIFYFRQHWQNFFLSTRLKTFSEDVYWGSSCWQERCSFVSLCFSKYTRNRPSKKLFAMKWSWSVNGKVNCILMQYQLAGCFLVFSWQVLGRTSGIDSGEYSAFFMLPQVRWISQEATDKRRFVTLFYFSLSPEQIFNLLANQLKCP